LGIGNVAEGIIEDLDLFVESCGRICNNVSYIVGNKVEMDWYDGERCRTDEGARLFRDQLEGRCMNMISYFERGRFRAAESMAARLGRVFVARGFVAWACVVSNQIILVGQRFCTDYPDDADA